MRVERRDVRYDHPGRNGQRGPMTLKSTLEAMTCCFSLNKALEVCIAEQPWPGRVVLSITGPPLFLLQSLLQGEWTIGHSCVQLLMAARFFLWLHHASAFSSYRELLTSWVSGVNSLLAKGGTPSLLAASLFCQGFVHGCPGEWPQRNGLNRTHFFFPFYPECPLRPCESMHEATKCNLRVSVSSHFLAEPGWLWREDGHREEKEASPAQGEVLKRGSI